MTTAPVPGDPFKYTTIAHHSSRILGPLAPAVVDELLRRAQPRTPPGVVPAVLDVGCGKGEILVRAMKTLGATGLGIDPNPTFATTARATAHVHGVGDRLTVHLLPFARAPVPRGAFDLVICTGALHAFGGADPWATLAAFTRPGGCALVGAGFWRRPPAPEYLAAIGADAAEQGTLADALAAPAAAGWQPVDHWVSSDAEWDAYETAYRDSVLAWAAARPADPDAPAFVERARAWYATYERWGRETMGFVSMLLRR